MSRLIRSVALLATAVGFMATSVVTPADAKCPKNSGGTFYGPLVETFFNITDKTFTDTRYLFSFNLDTPVSDVTPFNKSTATECSSPGHLNAYNDTTGECVYSVPSLAYKFGDKYGCTYGFDRDDMFGASVNVNCDPNVTAGTVNYVNAELMIYEDGRHVHHISARSSDACGPEPEYQCERISDYTGPLEETYYYFDKTKDDSPPNVTTVATKYYTISWNTPTSANSNPPDGASKDAVPCTMPAGAEGAYLFRYNLTHCEGSYPLIVANGSYTFCLKAYAFGEDTAATFKIVCDPDAGALNFDVVNRSSYLLNETRRVELSVFEGRSSLVCMDPDPTPTVPSTTDVRPSTTEERPSTTEESTTTPVPPTPAPTPTPSRRTNATFETRLWERELIVACRHVLNVTQLSAFPTLRARAGAIVGGQEEPEADQITAFCNTTRLPDGNHTCLVEFPARSDAVTVVQAANKGEMPGVYRAAVEGGDDGEKKATARGRPRPASLLRLCCALLLRPASARASFSTNATSVAQLPTTKCT